MFLCSFWPNADDRPVLPFVPIIPHLQKLLFLLRINSLCSDFFALSDRRLSVLNRLLKQSSLPEAGEAMIVVGLIVDRAYGPP